jgi:flavin-dependent dehydrogenase
LENPEVAVVGGGPAGAWCAYLLARTGVQVTLLHWSGYAPGGIELVSGRTRRQIEHHNPDFFHTTPPGIEVQETISLWSTPEPVVLSAMSDPWGPGIAVERAVFDHGLRDLASTGGVDVRDDAKVVGIEREADAGWKLSMRVEEDKISSLRAEFVVLATGRAATSFFHRSAAPESSKIALMTSLPVTNDKPQHALYVERTSHGWWYALPAQNGYCFAGFCLERDELKKRRGSLKEFYIEQLRGTKLLAPLLPHALDMGDSNILGRMAGDRPFGRTAGDGWIAVGDAAYAPDPLSGMGIELALESARLGAHAVSDAMNLNRKTVNSNVAFAEYDAGMREHAREHHRAAALNYAWQESWSAGPLGE